MNDLYCKDFEFLLAGDQQAYDDLKQSILKRSRLDLEFLQAFISFSDKVGITVYSRAKLVNVVSKDYKSINYITFCAEYLGLSESTIKKLYLTYERFVTEVVDYQTGEKSFSWALPLFSDMPLTKIFELLPCSLEQLRNAYDKDIISANMTQKQLREYVKSLKNGYGQANKVLEQIEKEQEEHDKQEAEEPKLKTYNKILDYIDFFKNTEETDPKQLKKLFVVDLHSIKNCLIKEFGLDIVKDKSLKLVNE